MTQLPNRAALDRVLELERELQSPECRADEARLRALLAPDFVEIGASGQQWDLERILTMLREENAEDDGVITLHELTARALAPGVVQVFWESQMKERHARRTSIWCERADGWQQVYHQGTPVP